MTCLRALVTASLSCVVCTAALAANGTVPAVQAAALDGHMVSLPKDFTNATILILGFSRNSATATTEWERAVRADLSMAGVSFYDMPVLASAPGFVRPMIVRSIRKQVPDMVRMHFVPLGDNEDGWKKVALYAKSQPDAAYVLLVDRGGVVRWQTHDACTPQMMGTLEAQARQLAEADKRN